MSRSRRSASKSFESLESRLLFYTFDDNLVHVLPYSLNFSSAVTGYEDANGAGTGFTRVQDNSPNNEYQPTLIQLDTANGKLRLTTSGLAQNGTNLGSTNSLINGLGAAFNASTNDFTITTTLTGPMNFMNASPEQVGIMFGPDQNNYIKLVVSHENGRGKLQFTRETGGSATVVSSTVVGALGLMGSIQLRLVGDPSAGTVTAQYAVNGNAFNDLPGTVTLTGSTKNSFFASKAFGSILATQGNNNSALTYTFDDFAIEGAPTLDSPTISSVSPSNSATNVSINSTVTVSATLPNSGSTINSSTVNSSTVKLVRTSDSQAVSATLNVSGNSITLTPSSALAYSTQYTVSVTSGLQDSLGAAFTAFSSTFTTEAAPANSSISASASTKYFNAVKASSSPNNVLVITNTGATSQTITSANISITGADAALFSYAASLPVTLAANQSVALQLKFNPTSGTSLGIHTASITVGTQDSGVTAQTVALRGLATNGVDGANEPSLQILLDLLQIPINVGDTDSSDTFIDTPPATPNDEVVVQRLVKANSGQPVTIEPIAAMAFNTDPAVRIGYYTPGQADTKTDLFSISAADRQSVNVTANGTTSFDPGSSAFGLIGTFPAFVNTDGTTREVTSEDALNYWEPTAANRRKVRFYPLKNSDGSNVANAYIAAFEEFTSGYDSNDVILIVRNVSIAPSGAQLGLINQDRAPYSDRLVFNRIQTPDSTNPNVVHDVATLTLYNTGTSDLVISSINFSSSAWQLENAPSFPLTISPGSSQDLSVKFVATSGGFQTGTMTINSNDVDSGAKQVALAGFWQAGSEGNNEPTLQQIVNLFGYTTAITNAGENINTGGAPTAVGDEVLSAYWKRADTNARITIQQLAGFHTQGNDMLFRYYTKGSPGSRTTVFTQVGVDSQSVLPNITVSGSPALLGSINTSNTIGFNIDNIEYSDDSLNTLVADGGHHLRFYPLKDRNGTLVANTYLLVMDYSGINYDYNDNVFIITNIKPENAAAPLPGSLPVTTATYASAIPERDVEEVFSAVEIVDSVG